MTELKHLKELTLSRTVSQALPTSRSKRPTREQINECQRIAREEGGSLSTIARRVGITEYYARYAIELGDIQFKETARIRKLRRLQKEINQVNKINIQVRV